MKKSKTSLFRGLMTKLIKLHFISCLVVLLAINGASGRADPKTRQLLQNIRSHIAQKAEEIVQQKECESGLALCKTAPTKEVDENEGKVEDLPPPPKPVRGHHKPIIKVNTKNVIQTMMPKVHKNLLKKFEETSKKPKISFHKLQRRDPDEDSEESEEEVKKPSIKVDQKPMKEQKLPEVKEKNQKNLESNFKKDKGKLREEKETENKGKLIDLEKKERKAEKILKDEKRTSEKLEDRKTKTSKKKTMDEAFPGGAFVFGTNFYDVTTELCKKHSSIYLSQLKKYKIWALMMYDASAKLPSGILQGNINQFGDFDECLLINAVFKKAKDSSGIKGKYCLANIDVQFEGDTENVKQALSRVESFSFVRSTVNDPGHFIPRFTSINWGLCVPAACQADDVERFLDSQLAFYNNSIGLRFQINVEEKNCVIKEDIKYWFDEAMVAVLAVYFVVLVTTIYATYREIKLEQSKLTHLEKIKKELEEASKELDKDDMTQEVVSMSVSTKGKLERVLEAFSLRKSWIKLVAEKDNDTIECVNGIKSIFTILLYIAHKTIPLGWTPFSNRIFLTRVSNEASTTLLRTSIIYTDSFLLISGLLTSYNLTKEIFEKGKISWVKKIIARFIRLTPQLFAILLFYAYVWEHLGSGPLWNLLVKNNADLCQKYMWRNLLYIQNFFAFEKMCAPQTHQLALDMQLSIIAPLFVYLLHKYDKIGFGILQALFLLSSIMRYTSASKNHLSVVIYHGMPVSQLYRTADLLYTQTIHRATPYIMGVIVGHYIQKHKDNFQMPKAFAALGWIIAFSFGFYSIVSPTNMTRRDFQYDSTEASQYAALSPIAWSVALAWFIAACHFNYGGKLNDFLSNRALLVFSRISYSVYLTQFLVFFYKVGVIRIPEVFTFLGSIEASEFFVVVLISVISTLLFDIPMVEIKNVLLQSNAQSEERQVQEKTSLESTESLKTESEYLEKISNPDSEVEENELYDEEEILDDGRNESDGMENEDYGEDDIDDLGEDEEIAMQPLRRSVKLHFDDEDDDREWLKIEDEYENEEDKTK